MDTEYCTKTGWLCLDFANTVDWHASCSPVESLNKYADLIELSLNRGIISGDAMDVLLRKSEEKPIEAQAVLEKAREIREGIYRILSDIAHGRPIKITDLRGFNKALANMLHHSRLAPYESGLRWDWDSGLSFFPICFVFQCISCQKPMLF